MFQAAVFFAFEPDFVKGYLKPVFLTGDIDLHLLWPQFFSSGLCVNNICRS